jgi:hypothetical protein
MTVPTRTILATMRHIIKLFLTVSKLPFSVLKIPRIFIVALEILFVLLNAPRKVLLLLWT